MAYGRRAWHLGEKQACWKAFVCAGPCAFVPFSALSGGLENCCANNECEVDDVCVDVDDMKLLVWMARWMM